MIIGRILMALTALVRPVFAADGEWLSGKEMVSEAQKLMSKGVPVIDVRHEACEGYVKGAVLIEVSDIEKKSPEALKKIEDLAKGNKSAKMAFYCKAGVRSDRAIKVLKELGYTGLINLGGVSSHFDPETMQVCK